MKTFAIIAALAATTAFTAPAQAAVISGLFNTGVDASNNPYTTNGAAELHYKVNGGTGIAYKHPAWVGASDAYWIAAQAGGNYSINPGLYTLTFDLTGLDAATAQISGRFAADDQGSVSLNGGNAINTTNGFSGLTAFSFNSGFVAGLNTLTFTVIDTGGRPAGLLVSGLSGTADVAAAAVPEPATWGMMLLGFGMVGFAARRRNAGVRAIA